MHKKYVVRLSEAERSVCQGLIKTLKGSSQQFRRAQILLKAEAEGSEGSDGKSAAACHGRGHTIAPLRTRLVTERCARALDGTKRQEPPTPGTRDGEAEAPRIARRLGTPPVGYGHWTLPRLADDMVAWDVVEAIRHATVRTTRKKNGRTQRKIAYGVMPPAPDAACVACREAVLATDAVASAPTHPVRCRDEQPVQWRKATRVR